MKKTENYELNKPESSDFYNIEHFNENADKIDEQLKENQIHRENKENPHNVTKKQLGLEKVDNTPDAEKPVSAAQQEAINAAQTAAGNAATAAANAQTTANEAKTAAGNAASQASSALTAANAKASFEEGTCTLYVKKFDSASYVASGIETKTVTANYIKIGKYVYVTLKPTTITFSDTSEGYVAFSGVPFQPADNSNVIGIWGIAKAPVGRYGFITYASTGNSPNMMSMGIGNTYAVPPSIKGSVQLTVDLIYRIA